MPDFIISLGIDRSAGQAAKVAAVADLKEIESQAKATATAEEQAANKATTAAAAGAAKQQAAAKQTGQARIQAAKQGADAEVESAKRGAAGYAHLGQTGAGAFKSIGVQMAVAQAGMQALTKLAGALGDGMERAAQNARKLGRGFADQRDDLRELASIQDRQADSAFTLEFNETGRRTGMTPEENRRFQTEFFGAGQQFVGEGPGKNISEGEAKQAVDQLGALGVAVGVDPGIMGGLGGGLLGSRDFKRYGDRASEEVMGRAYRDIQILQRGRSDLSQGLKAVTELQAAMLNEDEMKGAFTDDAQIAAEVSLMSEGFKGEEAVHARAVNRALNRFDDKEAGPLLEEAGITKTMPLFERQERIAKVIQEESARTATPIPQVISKYFPEEREKQALGVVVNRGVGAEGAVADRMGLGKRFGPAEAEKTVADFRSSEVGRQREADAFAAQKNAELGAAKADIEALRTRAEAELKAEGKIDTSGSNTMDALARNLTFGMVDNRALEIDKRVRRKLGVGGPLAITEEGREAQFNERIRAIRARGEDPLDPGGGEGGGEVVKALDRQTRLMQDRATAPLPNKPAETYLR